MGYHLPSEGPTPNESGDHSLRFQVCELREGWFSPRCARAGNGSAEKRSFDSKPKEDLNKSPARRHLEREPALSNPPLCVEVTGRRAPSQI
eukprot:2260850-Prymnesium_polylepis.1